MWRQQKDLAFADRQVVHPARFGELQDYVAAQLVKKLLAGVVMEVDPLIRAAHNLHDHAGVLEYQFVADRRLQQMAVCVDPMVGASSLSTSRPPVHGGFQ